MKSMRNKLKVKLSIIAECGRLFYVQWHKILQDVTVVMISLLKGAKRRGHKHLLASGVKKVNWTG